MARNPIIDIHQHALRMMYQEDGTPVLNLITGEPAAADSDDALLDMSLKIMEEYNVVKSLIFSWDDSVYRWKEAAPERFISSLVVIGDPPRPSAETLRGEIEAGRIMAIGEVISQNSGIPPNDPRVDPYFSLAEELDMPILIHTCGYGAFNQAFRCDCGNPLLLEDVLLRHPGLRLCIAHAGFPYLAETKALMLQYPQVYADISGINSLFRRETFHDYLRSLMRTGTNVHPNLKHGIVPYVEPISKRLMFGTDLMWWPEMTGMAIEAIESSEFLSEEQKRDIFYYNAKQFLRL